MPATDVHGKLRWLIAARVIAITLLLGSAILLQIRAPGSVPVDALFRLIGFTYAVSLIWTVTLRVAVRQPWLVDLQFACDALIVTSFVSMTGGITSYFPALYVLPVIDASTVQRRRGAMTIAVLSILLHGAIVLAQYQGPLLPGVAAWLHDVPLMLPRPRVALYMLATNSFGLLAVAFLSGSLAEGLRRADVRLERASAEIANLQAFNQHVIDSLASGLVTIDPSGRVLTFNPAAQQITGQPAAGAIGREVGDVLQLPADFAAALKADVGGARSRRTDFSFRRPDGRPIEIGLSATDLVSPGGRQGLLITFQDVTEIRKLQRERWMQQRLAAVGEMAAGIAHEIRNPLASMSGSIQVLRQELPLTAEQAQLMDIVLRESERLNDTIRSFLAYARPQRFRIARLDLARVLHDTALLLRNSAEMHPEHGVDVDVPAAEVWYEADEGQIRQIVWNLSTNGLRAMPSGGRLRLSAGWRPGSRDEAPGEGGSVVIEVEDQGVGIPPDQIEAMFEPFRGGFARGTGLGLAIVHRIVSDYDGAIEVKSQPGSGTTVRVRLPVRVVGRAEAV